MDGRLNAKDRRIFDELADLNDERRVAIRDAREIRGKFYPGWGCPAHFTTKEYPHLLYSDLRYLNADGLTARRMLTDRWDDIVEAGRDHILEKLKTMAPYVDAGHDDPTAYSPSEMMIFRYFIAVSDREHPERGVDMRKQALGWIAEARARWLAGCYANPMGERRPRP